MSAPSQPVHRLRTPRAVAALAALAVFAVAAASITPDPIGIFVDDGIYTLVAKALAAGHGYRYDFLPGTPPAIHYPPVFPLLLAAVMKLTPAFPANAAVLKFINPVCFAVGTYVAVRLGTRTLGLPAAVAAAVVVVSALIAPMLMLTNVVMSEPLFFAMLAVAILVVEDAVATGGWRRAVAAGVLCALVTLVRTVGGVVLPAAVLALWMGKRRRESVIAFVASLALLAPWQVFVWSASPGFPPELGGMYGPYLEWLVRAYRADPSFAWRVGVLNTETLWRTFGFFFAPRLPAAVQALASMAFLLFSAAGLMALRRRALSLAVFLLLYAGVVLAWPYAPVRFLGAMWPLAGLLCAAGAASVYTWLGTHRRAWQRPMLAAALLLGVGHAAYAARGLANGWAGSAQRAKTALLWPQVTWAAQHADAKDLIASDAHVIISLYTGRVTVPVSMLTPAEYVQPKALPTIAGEMHALDARYRPSLLVLVRDAPEADALPLFAALPSAPRITPIAAIPQGGTAYRVDRP